jgi:chaperonin GroES
MKTVPLRDFVLVTKDEQVSSSSVIHIVNTSNHITGTVLAVGSGKVTSEGVNVSPAVKVGDKVIFNKNIAVEIKVEDQDVYCMREEQIMCVVK